jgi:hypothetical protein
LLIPKFSRYAGRNKKYANIPREAREVKVLQRKVKQERKGAEREIKLDAQYLVCRWIWICFRIFVVVVVVVVVFVWFGFSSLY